MFEKPLFLDFLDFNSTVGDRKSEPKILLFNFLCHIWGLCTLLTPLKINLDLPYEQAMSPLNLHLTGLQILS